ncbi:hypothetical protein [Paenibacillus sp. FSL H7-0331]|uniref:hypothetical protein n=1 Tax=Paenibacillus sp. FSL H7-0331 TaxID=1920421 RepID=UPI004046EC59
MLVLHFGNEKGSCTAALGTYKTVSPYEANLATGTNHSDGWHTQVTLLSEDRQMTDFSRVIAAVTFDKRFRIAYGAGLFVGCRSRFQMNFIHTLEPDVMDVELWYSKHFINILEFQRISEKEARSFGVEGF